MPQYPIQTQTVGAAFAANHVTAAAALKATPGVLVSFAVTTAGTAGVLTFNDCATTGAATTANQIASIPFGNLTPGQVITFNWPCKAGVTMSAITTGGVVSVSYN